MAMPPFDVLIDFANFLVDVIAIICWIGNARRLQTTSQLHLAFERHLVGNGGVPFVIITTLVQNRVEFLRMQVGVFD